MQSKFVVSLSFSLLCLLNSLEAQEKFDRNLLVGSWKHVRTVEVDSIGNPIPLEELAKHSLSGKAQDPNSREYTDTLAFNSQNEIFDSVTEYGFNYNFNNSILEIGRVWIVLKLTSDSLVMMESPEHEFSSFAGGYDRMSLVKLDDKDRVTGRYKMKDAILGHWESVYGHKVKTVGEALHYQREHVVDTTSELIRTSHMFMEFDDKNFRLGTVDNSIDEILVYDLTDSTIMVDRSPSWFVLDIKPDTLSLLGPFGFPEDKMVFVWKFARKDSGIR